MSSCSFGFLGTKWYKRGVPSACRRHVPLFVSAIVAIALTIFATDAEAQIPPIQWQIIAQGSLDAELERPSGEAQVNLALYGIGLALGLGGGALLSEESDDDGWDIFIDLALQFRPLMLAASVREPYHPAYHIFDPHIDIGGLLGVAQQDETRFLGLLYVGGALDFGIPVTYYWMQSQIVISLGYRFVPLQRPLSGFEHHFVLGLGFRGGY